MTKWVWPFDAQLVIPIVPLRVLHLLTQLHHLLTQLLHRVTIAMSAHQSTNHRRPNSRICLPSRSAPIVISAITISTRWLASRQSSIVLHVALLTLDAAISLTSPTKKEELAIWKKLSVLVVPGRHPFHRHRLTFAVTSLNVLWLAFFSTFASDWISPDLFVINKMLWIFLINLI